ncbi:MAG: hypothetical protein M3Y23_02170 [Actinomycetota bacterium]|nr:hypothetical protein [Actinomycetota bacterium]
MTPAGDRPAGVRAQVQSPGWMRLSRGMAIRAVIEARLLGRKLLTLDADIAILPAGTEAADETSQVRQARQPRRIEMNGAVNGNSLVEAAKSLEAGAADLEAARKQMP